MKRTFAVVAGVIIGGLLAGFVSPMIIMVMPALRGPGLLWGVSIVIVALSAWVSWGVSRPRRE